jgi:ketosteroid isomerase-like protein
VSLGSRLIALAFVLILWTHMARADDKADVLAANKAVEESFSKLDIAAIEATWARGDVSVIHPASKSPIVGWPAVQKSYAEHPTRYKDFTITMDNSVVTTSGNVAWVVGIEKVHAHRANGEPLDISALATNLYEKRDGKWLMVHHHASRVPEDRGR